MLEGEGLPKRWEEWQYVEVNTSQHYAGLQRRMKLERKGGKQLTSDESKAIWMNLGYPTQLSACYLWLPLFTKGKIHKFLKSKGNSITK